MIKLSKKIVDKTTFYYCAVSMGVDSVASYLYLKNKSYNVAPVHINHNSRPQNDLMEDKYRELCLVTGDKPRVFKAPFGTMKTELDFRGFRIESFSKLSDPSKGVIKPNVITAHHLNDWVESYLLNCFRGHPKNRVMSLVSDFADFEITHPFLLTRKKDFKRYLVRNDYLKFVVEDETNKILKGSRRNWIRNFLVPEMKNQKLSLEKHAKRSITKLTEEFNSVRI